MPADTVSLPLATLADFIQELTVPFGLLVLLKLSKQENEDRRKQLPYLYIKQAAEGTVLCFSRKADTQTRQCIHHFFPSWRGGPQNDESCLLIIGCDVLHSVSCLVCAWSLEDKCELNLQDRLLKRTSARNSCCGWGNGLIIMDMHSLQYLVWPWSS